MVRGKVEVRRPRESQPCDWTTGPTRADKTLFKYITACTPTTIRYSLCSPTMASLAARRCTHALSHTRLHISAFAPARTGMMSASTWATSGASTSAQPTSPTPSSSHQKPPTPVVVPTDKTPLSSHAASPQIAARPPPAPRPQRPKPTLRSKKAALTIVRIFVYECEIKYSSISYADPYRSREAEDA